MRHAAGNNPHTKRHAKDSMQRSTNDTQQPTCIIYRQRGKDNRRHATLKRQQCNRQRATCDSRYTAGSAQRQQPAGNAQHLTDNRHRATASRRQARGSMQRATHARCNRKHTAPPHFAFRVRRAAGSGQPAACAKICTRQPARNTAQTPHKPMQHAANSHENTRGAANEIRTLAHLGALSVTPLPPRR